MSLLWPLELATDAKHRLYKHYLDAWWAKMLQPARTGFRWQRVTYVDAFAGPGRYLAGEEGSPVFVLDRLLHHDAVARMQLSRDRVRLVFVEKRRDRYEHLCSELRRRFGPLEQLPVLVDVRCGDAGEETERALDEHRAWNQPILAIFDSWGNVGVPLSVPERIAHNRSSEVITTFGPNWFSRREYEDPAALDEVFGGRDYWQQADRTTSSEERWRVWLETYQHALQRAGFTHRLKFSVVPHSGQPLYLVYGTRHIRGVEAMKDAMWKVDTTDGMQFQDPRTRGAQALGQQDLFGGGQGNPELHELLLQRIEQGEVSVETLGMWLLEETACWRQQDARAAVQALRKNGQVTLTPAGRVTKNTMVTVA